jgi:crossover junction endodeoxyribonuclease RuvC
MRILGIDPGLAILGWGIIDVTNEARDKLSPVEYGVITTSPKQTLPERLLCVYNGVARLIDEHKPDAVAFEELFFNRNVTTAFTVGAARGVVIVAAAGAISDLYEYTPLQIKQAVTGNGRCDKHQVQFMVRALLRLREIPKPDDAADALAVAITHAHCLGQEEQFRIR